METYDLIVIGFGKAGKTLAARYAKIGKKVALVEENSEMYGGTCINIGCIPTKTRIVAADKKETYAEVKAISEKVVKKLRTKNYNMIANNETADVYTAKAKFLSDKVIQISAQDGSTKQLSADIIVINTGARSNILDIPGLTTTKHVYDSTAIQKIDKQPKRLGIIGGGNIGLEFAGLYASLGSEVTIIDFSPAILRREDEEVAALAKQYLEEDGVQFKLGTKTEEIFNKEDKVIVKTSEYGELEFDAVLYATGRIPNVQDLGLENTNIQLTQRGAIKVNEYCETTVQNVFAVGDVNGGLQFTYTSLDDYRIVADYLLGEKKRSLNDRKIVPYTMFIKPALSRVGMIEKEAIEAGYEIITNSLLVANMPRAHVNQDTRGIFKVVVDKKTNLILGATLFSKNSEELINLIKMAIDNHIPYTYFKNQIFTHPTMAENLNDVFNF